MKQIYNKIKEQPQKFGDFVLSPFISRDEESRKKIFHSLKARAKQKRNAVEKLADWITSKLGSMSFLILNSILFVFWLLVNTDHFFGLVKPFDPFPFGLLTTAVSLEAIVLSIIVLISQNRGSRIDDIREEVHLQVNVIAEQEITKIIQMLVTLMQHQGIDVSKDPELKHMLHQINTDRLEKRFEKEID